MHSGILLDFLYELYYDARIHKHQVHKLRKLLDLRLWKLPPKYLKF